MLKRIKFYHPGETPRAVLRVSRIKAYAQEERSIEEIVNEGERACLDFAGYDFGNTICYPKFKYAKRYDEIADFL